MTYDCSRDLMFPWLQDMVVMPFEIWPAKSWARSRRHKYYVVVMNATDFVQITLFERKYFKISKCNLKRLEKFGSCTCLS